MFLRHLLPQPRTFWEGELGRLSRPDRKCYAKGRCPFHKSRSGQSFSVNLNTGAFCCFGCDVKGDIVSYVMQRDGCDFKTAAKKLGAWTDVTPEERQQFKKEETRLRKEREAIAAKKQDQRQFRHALSKDIRDVVNTQQEVGARLEILGADSEEAERCWHLLVELEDLIRAADRLYIQVMAEEFNG